MKNLIGITVVISLALFSCKNSTHSCSSKKERGEETAEEMDDNRYDIIISFISKSAGIDMDLKKKVDDGIETFNSKNETNITPEIIPWGREGEKDYLFLTKNLSTKQKKEFIASMKDIVGHADRAHISFDQKAVHKR